MSDYRLLLGDPDELVERFPGVLGLIPEQRDRGTEYMVASAPGMGQGAAPSIIPRRGNWALLCTFIIFVEDNRIISFAAFVPVASRNIPYWVFTAP
jgi:hypothetical protein